MKERSNKYLGFLKYEYLRIIALVFIFLFALMPLLSLVFNIAGKDLSFVFSDSNFWSSVGNSVLYSLIASVITTVLAVVAAYFLNTSSIKHKNIFVTILTLGMLVPTLSIGLGIRVLFGRNGFIDTMFNVEIEGIGFLGLIFGSIISSFPTTFLIIYDALKYEGKSDDVITYSLDIRNYKGDKLNTLNKDEIKILVTMENNVIVKVECVSVSEGKEQSLVIKFLGWDFKFEYPSDLNEYPLD